MSVYKRDGSQFYYYRFELGGREFRGTTGRKTKREALEVARAKRAAAATAQERKPADKLTLRDVLGYFWQHFGRHHSDAQTTFGRLERIEDGLGAALRIKDLDDQKLLDFSLRRRAAPSRRGGRLSAASVNREIELLRLALNKTYKPMGFSKPDLDWREALRREPEERAVEISEPERAALLDAVRADAADLFEHYLLTGVRLSMAAELRKDAIDWDAETVRFIGKGDLETVLPITPSLAALYRRALQGNPTDYVFTYVAQRTRSATQKGRSTIKGRRYPYTLSQVSTLWKRARAKAAETVPSVARLRLHDMRHDFGTKLYRATGDIIATQKLLGHRDARSTRRYVHSSPEDIRDALAAHHGAQSRHSSRHIGDAEDGKKLKRKK